ncbi:adrenoceptor alpha 1Bb [Brachyhypopomus gauderio]|uniref:adrenoceptor alpha 1Bb n=1 Tax=Brachyhypopomus gauderio TaxID=698409 RepID=UPI004041504F
MRQENESTPQLWASGSARAYGGTQRPELFNTTDASQLNGTESPELQLSRAVPLGLVLGTFIIFAVVGNILVILSVVCNKRLRTPTNYFIVNLAMADLLLSTTVLPVSATLEVLDYWVFGRIFCDVWAALDVLCCTASIMSLCVISIDRYIGVSHPLLYPCIVTERKALLAMLGVWVTSVIISIGPLLGWKQPPSPDTTVCVINEEPFYALFSSLGSFYIPLVVILVMYCRVYVVAKQTTRNLEAGVKKERLNSGELTLRIHRGSQMQDEAGCAAKHRGHQTRSSLTVKLLKFSREKKAAKTLGVVVGMFTACWLPFFLTLPIVSFNVKLRPSETLFKVIFWLGYFNSCLNPVIYPCYSREFKMAFTRILHCRWSQRSAGPYHSPYSLQSRKDSRDSVDNYSSYLNGSQRTLSTSSPCPSPGYLTKSPLSEHGGLHAWCRPTSALSEGFTDHHLESVREDPIQSAGHLTQSSPETLEV